MPFLFVLVIGTLLRLFHLGSIPSGMSHDELEYLNNGYSFFKTFQDLYQNRFPLTIGGAGYVSLPALIYTLPTLVFPLTSFTGRLMVACLGSLNLFLIYKLTDKLFHQKIVSFFAAVILAFSPWGLIMSRMAFDPPLSFFFFLLAILLAVSAQKFSRFFIALIVLSLGLFSYYGSIFIYPFVFFILIWYRQDLLTLKVDVAKIGLIFLLSLIFLWQMMTTINHTQSLNRVNELFFSDPNKLSQSVIFDRFHTLGPTIFSQIFINKLTQSFTIFFTNYLGAFSPQMIFLNGDPFRLYSLWNHGELNLLDLPLILIGLFICFKNYPRQFKFLLLLLIIAPISAGLTNPVYATRAFLVWPILIIFSALGAHALLNKNKKIFFIFFIGYLFFALQGIHQYFYRYPVYANETWFGSEKRLADYLVNNSNNNYLIMAPEARQMFMEYIFYQGFNPREVQSVLSSTDLVADIKYQNITFINHCPDIKKTSSILLITHTSCYPDSSIFEPLIKAEDKSDRPIWYILKNE